MAGPDIRASDLWGTWHLVSAIDTLAETGERVDVFGPQPTGYIAYGADGRMSVMIAQADRPRATSAAALTDRDLADLGRTFLAYGGAFAVEGDTVVHHVDISSNGVWMGTRQSRHARLSDGGDALALATPEQQSPVTGAIAVTEFRWQRIARA